MNRRFGPLFAVTLTPEETAKVAQEKLELEEMYAAEADLAAELAVQALVDDTCEVDERRGSG